MDIDKSITHFLAILFSGVLLGLVVYSVVAGNDLELAKTSMGFSAGMLGAIIGFYFNRERLVSESRAREQATSQRDDIYRLRLERQAEVSQQFADILRHRAGVGGVGPVKKEKKDELIKKLKDAQKKLQDEAKQAEDIMKRPR